MTVGEAILLLLTAGVWSCAMVSAAVFGPSAIDGWRDYWEARRARQIRALKRQEREDFNRLVGR